MILLSIILLSCAKSALPLGGGEKDEKAPRVNAGESSENSQTNWDGSDLTLQFDEWVTLKNKGLIIVSPPLKFNPETKLKGKTVTFSFHEDEILKDSTTYVINFGQSIVDFTEGNPVEDLVYVMSTGDAIDSLSIHGIVVDAYTGLPVEGVNVQAYQSNTDSILIIERPYYSTVTKEDGTWSLTNLREGTFQLFVLGDQNYNYTYDGIEEKVGYLDSLIEVTHDTLPTSYTLKAFSMSTVDVDEVIYRNSRHLKMKLTSTDKAFTLNSITNPILYKTQIKDSLFVWFELPLDSNSILTFTTLDSLVHDTLKWRRSEDIIDSLVYLTALSNQPSEAYPGDSIEYEFLSPIASIDPSQIRLFSFRDHEMQAEKLLNIDTIANSNKEQSSLTNTDTIIVPVEVNSSGRSLILKYQTIPENQYTLNINAGAIIDIYGQSHDTISTIFKAKSKENFSQINVSFSSSNSQNNYLLELYNSKNIMVRRQNLMSGTTTIISGLRPDQYSAKLIEDINKNQKWDTGDLLSRKQPEEIKSIDIEKLRENWDIELQLDWDKL